MRQDRVQRLTPPHAGLIHREGESQDLPQPGSIEVPAFIDHRNDLCEPIKVGALCRAEGIPPEERYHLSCKVGVISYHQHVGSVTDTTLVVRLDVSTSQHISNQRQHMLITIVLGDVELRNHLPLQPRGGITLDRHVETTFSVDKTRNVVADLLVWPSLLIACTHRIVTSLISS